jgi:PAS domain S-box-containing protein
MTELGPVAPAAGLARAQALVLALVQDSADAGRDHDRAVACLLDRVRDYLGLSLGLVSEVEGNTATVEYAVGETGWIGPGDVLPVMDNLCGAALQSPRPVVCMRDAGPPDPEDPTGEIKSYIGTRIMVSGRLHGTITLISREPRTLPVSETELGVFETAAALIGQHVALRLAEERYDLAMRGSKAGFWHLDVRRDEMQLSPRFRDMMGRPDSDAAVTLEDFLSNVHDEDADSVRQAITRHFTGGQPFTVEHRMRRADGDYIWLQAHGESVRGADGRALRMAGSVHDITQRRTAERSAQEHAEALRASNAELERFAYVTSHDLQEPLRKVRAFGDLLARDYADRLDDRGRKLLDTMIDGAGRMQTLIQDLLGYSRSAHVAMNVRLIDLDAMIADVAGDFDLALSECSGSIGWRVDGEVCADPVLMRQLVHNLVGNAVKYRDPSRPPRIELALDRSDDGGAHLSVTDNGIGFADEHARRIFEVFRRLHTRGDYPGTGIGLALCQRIVERHGGRIWAEGRAGEGAVFHVELPAGAPQEGSQNTEQ